MARTKQTLPEQPVTELDDHVVMAASDAADQLGTHLAEIERIYGDGTPFVLESSINRVRAHMGNACESLLAAGRELIRIKAHVEHGNFTETLEQLGLNRSTAAKMMKAAVRYSDLNDNFKCVIDDTFEKTNILILLAESTDEDIEEFNKTGLIAGHDLDEMSQMTNRELRAALKKARQEAAAKDQLLEDKNRKIDELDAKINMIDTYTDWDDRIEEVRVQATRITNNMHRALKEYIELADYVDDLDYSRYDIKDAACLRPMQQTIFSMLWAARDAADRTLDDINDRWIHTLTERLPEIDDKWALSDEARQLLQQALDREQQRLEAYNDSLRATAQQFNQDNMQ